MRRKTLQFYGDASNCEKIDGVGVSMLFNY